MKNRNAAKVPTTSDRYIGERIKEARIASKMDQKDLAELIGVSYQQLQKYESGKNRINGARIELLVTALNRPLTYFFPNATDVRMRIDPLLNAMMATKDGQQLVHAFSRIASPKRRRIVLETAMEFMEE
jgi:transcriptional regulator with XRE-family HTH domain